MNDFTKLDRKSYITVGVKLLLPPRGSAVVSGRFVGHVPQCTNRHVITPPPSGGRALPYLGGGVINFFSHFWIRAAPAAGFLRR